MHQADIDDVQCGAVNSKVLFGEPVGKESKQKKKKFGASMRMISLVNGINFFPQQRTVGSENSFIQWLPSATITFIFCTHNTHKLRLLLEDEICIASVW
jgi:hypothetical protein